MAISVNLNDPFEVWYHKRFGYPPECGHGKEAREVWDAALQTHKHTVTQEQMDAWTDKRNSPLNECNHYATQNSYGILYCTGCNRPMPQTAVPAASATCGDCVDKPTKT